MHSVLEWRKQWQKQYISIGKTDLFYNSMGLCGNFTQYCDLLLINSILSLIDHKILKSSFSISRVFSIMTVEKGQKQIINVLLQALEEPRLKNGFKTNNSNA